MIKREIKCEKGIIECYEIPLPYASFILLKAKNGYVMCGYLNMDTADKIGDIAGIVSGVRSIDDALKSRILQVSSMAREKGLSEGMIALDFLNKLF